MSGSRKLALNMLAHAPFRPLNESSVGHTIVLCALVVDRDNGRARAACAASTNGAAADRSYILFHNDVPITEYNARGKAGQEVYKTCYRKYTLTTVHFYTYW